jgi:Flp pilus assembly protein TadG
MVEFVLLALPIIFLTISILEVSLLGWKYHSMAYAIELAGRYACTHGRTCTKNGNACTITVANVANLIAKQAPALDSSQLNVTLTTHASSVTCNPLNSCFSNSSQFPNSTDNGVGLDVTITATYLMSNPLPMFWPGAVGTSGRAFTLGATSRQNIVF